jgi:hypothetical protein
VLRLILAFVDVMLHRRGPDSLPSSQFLLSSLFALSLAADLTVIWMAGPSLRWAAVAVLVFGLNIWFVWALLRTFNKQSRFRQTMTALLGANVILTLLQLPLVPLLLDARLEAQNPSLTLPDLLGLLILFWVIDICAFVFSRALERPYLLCVAIVLGYALLIRALQETLLQPVI